MSEQPTLESVRLILRPFAQTDAPAVQTFAGAREIADTTLAVPHPYPDGAAASWIATHHPAWETGTCVTYAITVPKTETATCLHFWMLWSRARTVLGEGQRIPVAIDVAPHASAPWQRRIARRYCP